MKKLLLLLIIPFLSFGQICEDPNSCTYLNSYWCGNNVCAYPGDLCDNPYYFFDDNCNCSPMFLPIVCEDINACNYLDTLPLIPPSEASYGSGYLVYDWNCNIISENACLYNEDCNEIGQDCVNVCGDPEACNYNPNAVDLWPAYPNDFGCWYSGVYDCDFNCVNDSDDDGICDEYDDNIVYGCMDLNACNYNENATASNNSCQYINETCGGQLWDVYSGQWVPYGIWSANCECININGCDDPDSCNSLGGLWNLSYQCVYPGDSFSGFLDPNPSGVFLVIGACEELSEECECCFRNNGEYSISYDENGTPTLSNCEEYVCGCMDENACNYDANALLSNNSCIYDDGCISVQEIFDSKNLLNVLDLYGREINNNKGYQLHIYDDGSVEKKYVIK